MSRRVRTVRARHPILNDIINKRIMPFAKVFVMESFENKRIEYEQSLLSNATFWPTNFKGMLPCSHGIDNSSPESAENQLLHNICEHKMPEQAMKEVLGFLSSLPGDSSEESTMVRAAYKVDEVRVQAALMLKSCVAAKGKAVLALDMTQLPMQVENAPC